MSHSLLFRCQLILSQCMLYSCTHKVFNVTFIFNLPILFFTQCDLASRSYVLILLFWLSLFIFILEVDFARDTSHMTSSIFSQDTLILCLWSDSSKTSYNVQTIFFWTLFLSCLAKLGEFLFHLIFSCLMCATELFLSIITWWITNMI